MCGAIRFTVDGKTRIVSAGFAGAELPIVTRDGGVAWLQWGASDTDKADIHLDPLQGPGRLLALPRGYWVTLDEVRRDARWDARKARPVKIAASAFLVYVKRAGVGLEQWIELKRGQYIQGALAQIHFTRRVYVVTVDPPQRYSGAKPCWPRIVDERD